MLPGVDSTICISTFEEAADVPEPPVTPSLAVSAGRTPDDCCMSIEKATSGATQADEAPVTKTQEMALNIDAIGESEQAIEGEEGTRGLRGGGWKEEGKVASVGSKQSSQDWCGGGVAWCV